MTAPSLFDEPGTDTLGPFQRHSSTSRRAALAAYPRTGAARERVLTFVTGQGAYGATDQEIQRALDMDPSTERPRRVELVDGGWLRAQHDADGGAVERPTLAGRAAQVWEVIPR